MGQYGRQLIRCEPAPYLEVAQRVTPAWKRDRYAPRSSQPEALATAHAFRRSSASYRRWPEALVTGTWPETLGQRRSPQTLSPRRWPEALVRGAGSRSLATGARPESQGRPLTAG